MKKIAVVYGKDGYTTGRYFESALRQDKDVSVVSIGVGDTDVKTGADVHLDTVMEHKPDAILQFQGMCPMRVWDIDKAQIPTAYYSVDTHIDLAGQVAYCNQSKFQNVFLAQKHHVSAFGANAVWMPLACDPLVHNKWVDRKEWDIAMVGGIDMSILHRRRRDYLKLLCKEFNVYVGRVYNLRMALAYNKAKIVFNCSVNGDLNMRFFEGQACGSMLLTDYLPEVTGINEFGNHFVTYEDGKDLVAKCKQWLNDNEVREQIASKGYLAMKQHTYACRMKEIKRLLLREGD